MQLYLEGEKLKGAFAMARIKGKGKDWLLIKKRDSYADPSFRLETVLKG
jgi:hypothetical protein